MSNILEVSDLYLPTCQHKGVKTVEVGVHESIDLECEMEATPSNLTFTWQLKGTDGEFQVAPSQFTQHGSKSVLTLTPRTPADLGEVVCSSSNFLGLSNRPCIFHIAQPQPDPQDLQCDVELYDNELRILCDTDLVVYPRRKYKAEILELESGLSFSKVNYFLKIKFNILIYSGGNAAKIQLL